jgi:hypothetical protein
LVSAQVVADTPSSRIVTVPVAEAGDSATDPVTAVLLVELVLFTVSVVEVAI